MNLRRIPGLALALAATTGLAWMLAPILRLHPGLMPPCLFKEWTGFPCLTCGLTRCILSLAEGRLTEAFQWHPVAAASMLLLPFLAAWDLARAFRGRPYPPLPEGRGPRLVFALLLVGTWILQVSRGI